MPTQGLLSGERCARRLTVPWARPGRLPVRRRSLRYVGDPVTRYPRGMTYENSDAGRRDARELRAQYEANPDASPVLYQFGAWFVTEYGVEGLQRGSIYHIDAAGLWEDQAQGQSWEDHLVEKSWMTSSDMEDLRRALAKGREVHAEKRPT